MFNKDTITQDEVELLASFEEAASEYQSEPFNGKDEARLVTFQGNDYTFKLGDRFHLKSALVPFRRMWMKNEPASWGKISNLLSKHQADALASYHAENVKKLMEDTALFHGFTYPTHRLIDLWLNTVFAHGGIEGKNKRGDFEALINQYGHGIVEYSFRMQVWKIGIEFINISKLGVLPLLKEAEVFRGLKPSFRSNYAFGNSQKEVTKEGHTIIRRSSTKYSVTESLEDKFKRILNRHELGTLKSLLGNGEITASLIAEVMSGLNVERLAQIMDYEIQIVEDDASNNSAYDTISAYNFLHGSKVGFIGITAKRKLLASQHGLHAIAELLEAFRREILKEG